MDATFSALSPTCPNAEKIVDEEVERLNHSWSDPRTGEWETRLRDLLGGDRLAEMDAFDRVQVSHVIEVCRQCRSLSEAGRLLFSASRGRKATTNDADRLRKYLNRFGIEWAQISSEADSARSQ
jgi:transcriptional regulatory protein RtcR